MLAVVLPSISAMEVDGATLEAAKNELFAQFSTFDKFLLMRSFLVGERCSWADISVAFTLLPAFQHSLGEGERMKFTNLSRWFNTIVHQNEVMAIIGDVQLPAKASTFDGKVFRIV